MPELISPVIPAGALRRHDQPTLSVDELVVRPWEPSDAPAVVAAYRDPDIQRWHLRSMTEDEALRWVRDWPGRWAAETAAGWAVTRDDRLVGRVGFRTLNLAEGVGEAAYWVVPAARGLGVAPRVLTVLTAWMFDHVGFHRMALAHSTRNAASCRVAGKAGYVYEGTQRQQALHTDGWHDMHLHARVALS
ncbi:GNAT family N-acetyltransferase [Actinokineospora iranica]|uniref:Protein N-acetyltransferase, RimJ/RimL family n=1 Tax=Actinokineospora iranica TaxID=1271860 RepID=A0A1G6MTB8_9PSEU|nr:GNAT family N-acetyltransferase [Actinokineospora iranica]SDC58769.1 Protein N-acetyltransferase, RimJ/RimL family [Actinokineospora iranica]